EGESRAGERGTGERRSRKEGAFVGRAEAAQQQKEAASRLARRRAPANRASRSAPRVDSGALRRSGFLRADRARRVRASRKGRERARPADRRLDRGGGSARSGPRRARARKPELSLA